ncbi:MAG: hypothetical protein JXR76_31385 [Deltaproteobacteria bacterium]|nr:hypothetical protein [Deltaproteobacteria bacterium]
MKAANIIWSLIFLLWSIVVACGGNNNNTNEDSQNTSEGNTDSDTDTDSDAEGDGDADSDGQEPQDSDSDPPATDTDRQPPWADVIEVEMTGSDGNYEVMATFQSTDIDCTEYANWLEVLTEDGDLLYRRILVHPHTPPLTGNPVARGGGPVTVSADDVIIIRAHINTVGYKGMAMRGSVNNGFEPAPDITPDFAADVESQDPQPDGCTPEEAFVP